MAESLKLILIFIPLVAGAIGIFLAYQLMRKYHLPFVSSYFYFLVFLYIFGTYSLIGGGILEHLLTSMEADQDIIRTSRIFATLPGIPLLSLSLYAIIRSFSELLSKKIWKSFTVIYFILSLLGLLFYGFWAFKLTRLEQGDHELFILLQRWVFAGLLMMLYLSVFLLSLFFSKKMISHERRFVRISALLYLLYMILTVSAFSLSELHPLLPLVFILFFLSWHLIPIFFMSLHLGKYHGEKTTLQQDFDVLLASFARKYDISKREKDVIRLISKGLSNQEISDALYISLQTVKDHTHRIFTKTGVKNRVQLTNLIRSNERE